MPKVYDSIAKMVGKTPMFQFVNLRKNLSLKANLFGKCEFYNPLFSIKDRVALKMIEKATENNVNKDKVFITATDGNMGVAIAALGAAEGLKLLEVVPENVAPEIIKMIKFFGADVVQTPAEDGIKGAIAKTEILAGKSDNVFMLKQLENNANIQAHLFDTSTEIFSDMNGEVDVLIVPKKTGATLKGIAQALRSSNPDLCVVAAILNENASRESLNDKDESINQSINVCFSDAIDMTKMVAQMEGLPIGVCSGAAMVAAINVAVEDKFRNKNIVVVLPDKIDEHKL